ncbi:NACHT domain-containing NTPase [Microcoleus sp. FACHB-68]|uniref:NACHT domain-containing protein n=1 Tax=Microcoleus sp. FACHB-68 TaxID=2692826 RepID=UPI001F54D318|nr:NACHT domain-containing NTPase [Microcoleus sp. FACHB-68]
MTQSIGLNDIYTSVNILEKITGRRGIGIDKLMQGFDPEQENFDRVGFGEISEERVPGIEAVKRYSKLMVLGKPGAGKTTFLKYLAIQCIGGEFLGDRVPIFITLKDFAETDTQPGLIEFINQRFAESGVTESQTADLLKQGRVFLLLDGLDEVREEDASRVIKQIERFSERYSINHFAMTCRIAAREHTFQPFKEVEVADFNNEQIKTFVGKWFQIKQLSLVNRFMTELEENESIKELATNPLLLTLLCLEFEDSGDFPKNRSELYERATHTLLRKWDSKRGIKRDQVYKNLFASRKEDLLSQLALSTFERKEYFFKQRDAERYITDYIRNLPDAKTDPEALQLDSEAVLKSIEAQHGLLVERARGIYSFSHLTFQEYFTARKIFTSCNPDSLDDKALQSLACHITEHRWREVFSLTLEMLPNAESLLLLMKQQVDTILAEDEKLQKFLRWVNQKSLAVDKCYEQTAVRVFYFCLEYIYNFNIFSIDDFIELADYFNIHSFNDYWYCSGDKGLKGLIDLKCYELLYYENISKFIPNSALADRIENVLDDKIEPHLKQSLQKLRNELADSNQDQEKFQEWWQSNRQTWINKVKVEMIKYRNIAHDWQLNSKQFQLLEQYYDANLLLVECLSSDCVASPEVRQEIEDTLLLPIAEIEKRKNRR